MKKACPEHGRRVYIGMSGGVDSSVSAALLKKAGYQVIGVFIRVWEPFNSIQGKPAGFCSWREERREARRVAAHLNIPLLTLDLSREYKKRVVDYFIAEYKAGRTPNPDVMCNKHIKFGVFYDWAMKNGADFVATGHYAINRCESANNTNATNKNKKNSPHSLNSHEFVNSYRNCQFCQSTDNEKDQTYFLWNLKTEQLAKILFPIGGYTKPQVRALAKKFDLPNALKKDSQGLCFVGKIDFKDFLKHELKEKTGNVLNEQGEVIGKHEGSIFFTLGERHGFEVFAQTPDEKPYYIIAKDTKKNTLTVSQQPYQGQSLITEVKIEKTNWITDLRGLEVKPLGASRFNLQARLRYRQPLNSCKISQLDLAKNTATIIFDQPQLATPGQSLVLYSKSNFANKGLICLGGGVIK
jgi:tRNA-specific 2-thiouridylase